MNVPRVSSMVMLALLAPGAWAAGISLTASVDPDGISFSHCLDIESGNQVAFCSVANPFPTGFGSYIGESTAQATFGSLRVAASSAGIGHDPRVQLGGGGTSAAQVQTTDNLTVVNGPKAGFLRVKFNINGSLTFNADPSNGSFVSVDLGVNGVSVPGFPMQGNAGAISTSVLYDIPFAAGSTDLALRLSASSRCAALIGANNTCTAAGDFSHTVDIAGVEVLDSQKAFVPGASIASQSGFVYPPLVSPPTTDSAKGPPAALVLKYSSAAGFANLAVTYVLFNGTADRFDNACLIHYDQAANAFFLLNDSDTADLGPLAPGANGSLSNGQCTLNGAGSSVSGSGSTLTVTVNVGFSSSFGPLQNIFLYAADKNGLNSGFNLLGSTGTIVKTNPTVDSVTGVAAGSKAQTLTLKYSSFNGFAFLNDVYALINDTLSGQGGCFILYDKPANLFFLVNDAGTGIAGTVAPGSGASTSNSQCTLSGTGSSVSGSGPTLSLVLNLTFAKPFGSQKVFGYALDRIGLNSGWQNLSDPQNSSSTRGSIGIGHP